MKKVFALLTLLCITLNIFSQSPEKISYQAIVRNMNGQLASNQTIGMKISILQNTLDGITVYSETQTPTTNVNGLVSIEIGSLAGFSEIDWSEASYFIKTETDPTGGINYTIIGTSQILSVPYALHAKTAEKITSGITETDPIYKTSQSANITTNDITNLSNLSGVNTGDQDLSGLATVTELTNGLSNKVDKVSGKGLSTEDYTTDEKTKLATITGTNTGDQDLSSLATTTSVAAGLSNKIDKVTGKGLSTEDYTTVEKTKLATITGTNTGDQDLSSLATTTSVTAGLSNKVDKVTGKGLSTEDYTTVEKTKLATITGTNTGDQDLSKLATQKALEDTASALRSHDNDTLNEIQMLLVSLTGDTLYLSKSNYIIIPGISIANHSQFNNTLSDIVGNVYQTVEIGTQTWIAENLKTTKYNDGNVIPNITDDATWAALSTPAYCWYNNDSITYAQTYGALYNWRAVNTGKLCPAGWHVASEADWTALINNLDGESVAGGKLKEKGTIHWNSPNTGASNETGFKALPGGYRNDSFENLGNRSFWWGATKYSLDAAYYLGMYFDNSSVYSSGTNQKSGFYVRCLKD